jgi:hypothetical protein
VLFEKEFDLKWVQDVQPLRDFRLEVTTFR